ncbi:hypothetical protein, variant 2 [Aphanomyces astaci]|uniref:EF-hand domain-containing protein n=1 Tax=Aphanomyces astaci TaxID=112090 RepID=W4GJU7_APHAT|nr:hypothetical protein, variant 2 [Aphanomyces astaci]ETV79193.1 hypothetical protein, variant 2 [Aphanomyces astaci]|eukprot:XP_009831034.1 hypothetical protein, variant 2 [Aphanomyces astaci]
MRAVQREQTPSLRMTQQPVAVTDDLEHLFGSAQIAAPSKMDTMNPTDVNVIRALVSNTDLVDRFSHQIALYGKQRDHLKPEDTLRRFSLNGDNKLDFREFHPALKRLFGHGISHTQSKELFGVFCPTSGKKLDIDQFCQIMGHWCQVAERIKDQQYLSRPSSAEPVAQSGDGLSSTLDNNANIRRGLELATKHYDKLNAVFLNMDVGCTGYLSKEEFELAMTHLGVYLNTQEYERLYAQLPSSIRHESSDGIYYAGFLAMLGVKMTTLFQNQKLWEMMLQHGDVLRKYLTHCQKQGKSSMSPDHFRDLLGHCGITLSNGDFTGLRMRMQEFQDVDGHINLADFLAALNDKAAFLANSTGLVGCTGPPSPPRRGKKMVDTHDSTVYAAGKSTEQRNAEAQTCRGKSTDEMKKKHPTLSDVYNTSTSPASSLVQTYPTSLEDRIFMKMKTCQDMGYTHCATLKSIFPGDRFGKVTRGQFRQSLAQLNLVSRHAEVEALFWQLDPAGRGYIGAHDLHIHLQKYQPTNEAGASQPTASPPSPKVQYRSSLRVDEKKFFDALQDKLPNVLAACRSVDPAKTGCISRGDFIWALRQGGLILSHADATSVIATLSSRKDGVVLYHTIADSVAAVLQLPGANNQSTAKKTNRHHLSNTAVLLDQQAVASIEPATTLSGAISFDAFISKEYVHPRLEQ